MSILLENEITTAKTSEKQGYISALLLRFEYNGGTCCTYWFCEMLSAVTHPEVWSSKAVRGRDVVGRLGGVSVVGIDVSQ